MCGIIGFTGSVEAPSIILNGLKRLEYRGYDSAGAGFIENGKILLRKVVGSPDNLEDKLKDIHSSIGIGHNRWATHGAPDEANAHPHLSENGVFAVVHNGIIENYSEIKEKLISEGYNFKSETDTEVVCGLLEKEYHGDIKETIGRVISSLDGSYAMGILCRDYPDTVFCVKHTSPLFVCMDKNGGYLASDIAAFSPEENSKIYKLSDNEIGIIKKDSFKIYDIFGCRIRKNALKIKGDFPVISKGEFSHFMLKEIYEQSEAVSRTIDEIFDGEKIKSGFLKLKKEKIRKITHIDFVGCGSAYHAGVTGAYVTESLTGIPCRAQIASEYKNPVANENTMIIFISQSGETADTLSAIRKVQNKNAVVIAVVNNEYSSMARECSDVILTRAGKEVAVATTKAYSAQLCVMYSVAVKMAYSLGKLDRESYLGYCSEIKSLPDKINSAIADSENIRQIAEKISEKNNIYFIGRGLDYCAALEGALKLKEVSYTHCEAYPAGELKHGTISLIEDGSLVIALTCDVRFRDKTLSNIKECKSRGAKIICISNEKNIQNTDDFTICTPSSESLFSSSLSVIPLQLIAYYTALKKGCSIDKPKNLAKSVTVE